MKALLVFFIAASTVFTMKSNADKIILSYADGSGNSYVIKSTRSQGHTLSYFPVKPEFSSSGIYDGGQPVNDKPLGEAEFKALQLLFEKALKSGETNTKGRNKGTGLVQDFRSKKKRAVLKMNAPEKEALEAALKKARGL